jgi:nicotinate-nucleotide pyrophosphorylase (carboxylating)
LAGLVAAPLVLEAVAELVGTGRASAQVQAYDGCPVAAGQVLAELHGPAATLLAAERTLLNIATHLSGTATLTAAAVAAVAGTATVVRDTRKTHPGLRALEKYAVRCGGGANHRMSLSDAILVKDNHIAALGGVGAAVRAAWARAAPAGLSVEVEVDSLAELDEALLAGATLVLLDNMPLDDMRQAVRRADRCGAKLEASGGLTLTALPAVAATGVHFVAVGALTHSAPALDIGLDWSL